MKSAVIPQVRVEPELRAELEAVLRQGETLTDFVEASVRNAIAFRRVQTAFHARAQAASDAYHEALYRRLGKPVTTTSMHLYGGAADLEHHVVPLASARALRLFSGIGYQSSQPGQPMSHADVRHAVGDMLHRNPRMRTPSNPEVWAY